ncbi:MAG: ribosomal protein large subunit ribosomal protein [Candidatus Parcubacteria bacterium]|jgi:large subunit ribosomal protein L24
MKIKKDDNVIVITGKEKGKTGKVTQVFPREDKILIAGFNIKKVHSRARKSNEKGQIIEKSMPIHISNVLLVDPKTNKGTRVGFKMEGDKKVRVTKKSASVIK